MHNRRLFELIILGLWLFVAVVITLDYNVKTKIFSLQPNNEIEIKTICGMTGDSFDLILKDKSRITVSLPVTATEEAKQKIIDMLSKSSKLRVFLYNRKKDGNWSADLKFSFKEKEFSLKDWLISNKLTEEEHERR